jgi:hypothetical protein
MTSPHATGGVAAPGLGPPLSVCRPTATGRLPVSNETDWPWYSNVAPLSWMIQRDIDEGRDALNFSEWDRDKDEAEDAAEIVADGEIPPLRYELAHAEARLSDGERRRLIQGLARTFGGDDNSGPGGGDDNSGARSKSGGAQPLAPSRSSCSLIAEWTSGERHAALTSSSVAAARASAASTVGRRMAALVREKV